MQTVSLVTGGNRGIGMEVCRQLAQLDHRVLLTARSLEQAEAAAQQMGNEHIQPMQLDITDAASIERLRNTVEQKYGRLDVLVNNAAILYDTNQRVLRVDFEQVYESLQTNTIGAWRMMQAFAPLLRKSRHPRIVNVSSGAAEWAALSGGTPTYSISKVALNALTIMVASEMKKDKVLVNAVCPGWVATDMGGPGGRPVADGARGIVWAATLPDDGPTGGFFRDGQRIDW